MVDRVESSLLLSRLQGRFGVEGICLAWFVSYLSERTYCVDVDGLSSKIIHIIYSVPQGRQLIKISWFWSVSALKSALKGYYVPLRDGMVKSWPTALYFVYGGVGGHCCSVQMPTQHLVNRTAHLVKRATYLRSGLQYVAPYRPSVANTPRRWVIV